VPPGRRGRRRTAATTGPTTSGYLTLPGAVGQGTAGRPLPPTLLHAVEEFEADPVITGVLDTVGEGVAAYFAKVKRDEFFSYHSAVSPWEIDNYLTAF
jgi:glutamine synthetase